MIFLKWQEAQKKIGKILYVPVCVCIFRERETLETQINRGINKHISIPKINMLISKRINCSKTHHSSLLVCSCIKLLGDRRKSGLFKSTWTYLVDWAQSRRIDPVVLEMTQVIVISRIFGSPSTLDKISLACKDDLLTSKARGLVGFQLSWGSLTCFTHISLVICPQSVITFNTEKCRLCSKIYLIFSNIWQATSKQCCTREMSTPFFFLIMKC